MVRRRNQNQYGVMETLLKAWEVDQKTIDAFVEHGFDLDTFKVMVDEDYKALFPTVGSKVRFRSSLEKWKRGGCRTPAVEENPQSPASGIDTFEIPVTPLTIVEEQPVVIDEPTATTRTPGQVTSLDEIFRPETNRDHVEKFLGEMQNNEFKQPLRTAEDVRMLLSESLLGSRLLSFYDQNGFLTQAHQNSAAKMVIIHELQCDANRKVHAAQQMRLRELLCQLFPTTVAERWYTPFKYESTGCKHNACGKLQEQYYHLRKVLLRNGLVESLKHKRGIRFGSELPTPPAIMPSPAGDEDNQSKSCDGSGFAAVTRSQSSLEPDQSSSSSSPQGWRLLEIADCSQDSTIPQITGIFLDDPLAQAQGTPDPPVVVKVESILEEPTIEGDSDATYNDAPFIVRAAANPKKRARPSKSAPPSTSAPPSSSAPPSTLTPSAVLPSPPCSSQSGAAASTSDESDKSQPRGEKRKREEERSRSPEGEGGGRGVRRAQELLLENMLKRILEEDDVDLFTRSIALSIKKLPPKLINQAKLDIMAHVSKLELRAAQEAEQ